MSRRRVLFLVSDFAPLTSVGRIRTQKMCKLLPEFGWEPSVLTFEPPPGTLTDPQLLEEIPVGTSVHRVACPQPIEVPLRWASRVVRAMRGAGRGSPPGSSGNATVAGDAQTGGWLDGVSRGVNVVKRRLTRAMMIPDEGLPGIRPMVRKAMEIVGTEKIDAIVSSVPGFAPWLAAVQVGRRTGVPVMVDYRDLWHGDVLRSWVGPLRSRLELGLERRALAGTAAVVTVSEGKTDFVRKLDPRADGKPFVTIYNGFDEDDLTGIAPVRPERDANRLLLLYTGRLYGHRRIDPLVASIGRLVGQGAIGADEIRLRIVGLVETDQQERVTALAGEYGLGNAVEFGGYVTRREALAQQLGADALVLVVDPGETSDGVLPGKITEYIGLGKFVLGVAPRGEATNVLQQYGHAAWASGTQQCTLDAAVATLVEQWRTDPDLGRKRVGSKVIPSRRENAADLAEVLDRVAGVVREVATCPEEPVMCGA